MLGEMISAVVPVSDIRVSRCSVGVYGLGRNRITFAIHGSSNPCLDIVSKHCWVSVKTPRNSNIRHKEQPQKSFRPTCQSTLWWGARATFWR